MGNNKSLFLVPNGGGLYVCNEEVGLVLETTIFEDQLTKRKRYLMQGVMTQAGVKNRNGRMYDLNNMVEKCNEYQADIAGGRAVGEMNHPNCHSGSAKIMSTTGLKFIKDIADDEEIFTLNPETGLIEIQKINKKIVQKYKGKMYRLLGRGIDTLVTPEHRFLIYNRKNQPLYLTASEIYEKFISGDSALYHSYIPKTGQWNGIDDKDEMVIDGINECDENYVKFTKYDCRPDLTIPMDLFLGLLGLFLSEGYSCKNGLHTYIYQVNLKNYKTFKDLFDKLSVYTQVEELNNNGIWKGFRISDRRLNKYFSQFGLQHERYVPFDIKQLSSRYLEILLYWFNLGDGRNSERYDGYEYISKDVFSTSERMIDDFHEILLKTNQTATRFFDDNENASDDNENASDDDYYMYAGHRVYLKNKRNLYYAHYIRTKGIYLDPRFLKIDEVDYDDYVYCVNVDNSNFYCCDNGTSFWSGNCLDVNPERVCIKINSYGRLNDTNDFIGEAEVLPYGLGLILQGHMEYGIRVGTSSRVAGKLKESKDCTLVDINRIVTPADVVWSNSAPKAMPDYKIEEAVMESVYSMVELMGEAYAVKVNIGRDKLRNATKSEIKNAIHENYLGLWNIVIRD